MPVSDWTPINCCRCGKRFACLFAFALYALEAYPLLVAHFGPSPGQALDVIFVGNLTGKPRGSTSLDAALCKALGDTFLDDLPRGAQFLPDAFGLPDKRLQNDVGFSLCVSEIPTSDALRRLQLAVNTAVTLLKTSRVPRKVKMNEIGAVGLKVDAFASGVFTSSCRASMRRTPPLSATFPRTSPIISTRAC